MRAELLAKCWREWPAATTCEVSTATRESSFLSFCLYLSLSPSSVCRVPLTGSHKPDSTMALWRCDGTLGRDRGGTVQKCEGWANHVYMCGSSAYVKGAAIFYSEKKREETGLLKALFSTSPKMWGFTFTSKVESW